MGFLSPLSVVPASNARGASGRRRNPGVCKPSLWPQPALWSGGHEGAQRARRGPEDDPRAEEPASLTSEVFGPPRGSGRGPGSDGTGWAPNRGGPCRWSRPQVCTGEGRPTDSSQREEAGFPERPGTGTTRTDRADALARLPSGPRRARPASQCACATGGRLRAFIPAPAPAELLAPPPAPLGAWPRPRRSVPDASIRRGPLTARKRGRVLM